MSVPSTKSRVLASRSEGMWLAPLAGHWIDAARQQLSRQMAVVRVTVTALRGSAPREPGASLLVDALGTAGTIGGGRLEWHATSLARQMLLDSLLAPVRIAELILGPELGQCCGGRVELWLQRLTRADLPWLNDASRRMHEDPGGSATWILASELDKGRVIPQLLRRPFPGPGALELKRSPDGRMTLCEMLRRRRPNLWIFGAGHVGQALVRLLAELALFEITWVDSRSELLPSSLPDGVTAEVCLHPADRVTQAPAGTRFVVLTHDHALDYELCRLILARADSSWLGLIGSASKAARFRSRLQRHGLDRQTVSRLTCPIGVPGISSKLPAAIAIAIAAQLLQQTQVPPPERSDEPAPEPADAEPLARSDLTGCAGDCGSCGSGHPQKA
jgi:xanthine dehydrogenase accessory factor